MKKLKTVLLVFILIAANTIYANAQKISEGKVVYEISYPNADMPDEQMAMMPTEMTIYFKDMKARMEMPMGMGMNTTIISDGKSKSATTLLDMMGNKMAIKSTTEELKQKKEKSGDADAAVKLTDETKKIAGYNCKKASVTAKDGSTFDVYYTDEIENKSEWEEHFKGIKGFMMEYQMKQGQMDIKMIAKTVSADKVDDSKFAIPADYKETTQEEMKKMFGGGGQ